MFTLLLRLFDRLLLGSCFASLSLVFLSIAVLLRLLPRFLRLLARGVRGLLVLSFRLYQSLLLRLDSGVRQYLGVDITNGLGRVFACVLMSLVIGLPFLLFIQWPRTIWGIVICLVHGLAVGLAWDEIAKPGGLQLGVGLE